MAVTPLGGKMTLPRSPYLANIFFISSTFVKAGKFFTSITVLERVVGGFENASRCTPSCSKNDLRSKRFLERKLKIIPSGQFTLYQQQVAFLQGLGEQQQIGRSLQTKDPTQNAKTL